MQFSRLFALAGLIQGWLLWWLWQSVELQAWPAGQPLVHGGLLFAVVATPLVVYWTEAIDGMGTRFRALAITACALLFGALGSYTAWASGDVQPARNVRPAIALAAVVLGFVGVSLLVGFDRAARRWRYARLFFYAWRNVILSLTAAAMTAAVWVVLAAGAGLMGLIDAGWVMALIKKPAFIFPVTGLVVAGSFALGLARAAMVEAIRRFWLSIAAWLLLLVLAFALAWVAMLPFSGLDSLFGTQSAALIMLWFAALAVKFANCAYQDGNIKWPYPVWCSWLAQAAWLSLIPVVGIAWWALGLRVVQHGWTEQRLWAALIAALAMVYALGYALSLRDWNTWMRSMARTNIVAAWALCLGLVAFISPLADVQRLGVSLHLDRVAAQGGQLAPDWDYLRWRSGRFGREALQALAAGQGLPAGVDWAGQAAQALARSSRDGDARQPMTAAEVIARFNVHPRGRALPDAFVQQVMSSPVDWRWRGCLAGPDRCSVWLGDLNSDGRNELVLLGKGRSGVRSSVWGYDGQAWTRVAEVLVPPDAVPTDDAQLDSAGPAPSLWNDLMIGGHRFRVRPEH